MAADAPDSTVCSQYCNRPRHRGMVRRPQAASRDVSCRRPFAEQPDVLDRARHLERIDQVDALVERRDLVRRFSNWQQLMPGVAPGRRFHTSNNPAVSNCMYGVGRLERRVVG